MESKAFWVFTCMGIGIGCGESGSPDAGAAGMASSAGNAGWRLPTYKELYSLAEYPPASFSEPEVDEAVFDIDGVNYLPATTGWGPDALDVLFNTYDGDRTGPGVDYPIMCVRWK